MQDLRPGAGERLRAATQEVTQEHVMSELQFSLSLWRACGWMGVGEGGGVGGPEWGTYGLSGPSRWGVGLCQAPLDFLTWDTLVARTLII